MVNPFWEVALEDDHESALAVAFEVLAQFRGAFRVRLLESFQDRVQFGAPFGSGRSSVVTRCSERHSEQESTRDSDEKGAREDGP